jgi:hypothetical protein
MSVGGGPAGRLFDIEIVVAAKKCEADSRFGRNSGFCRG